MPYKDLVKRREYQRNWVRNSEKDKENHRVLRRKRKDLVDEYKSSKGCSRCGETDPIVLDLHHHSDDKDGEVSHLASSGYSWEKIKREMDKCEVLCCNCHRKVHRVICK